MWVFLAVILIGNQLPCIKKNILLSCYHRLEVLDKKKYYNIRYYLFFRAKVFNPDILPPSLWLKDVWR